MKLKINIFYSIKDVPWGGGNQFLKALKNRWISLGNFEEDPAHADVILFNSFNQLPDILRLKQKYPDKIFIHRVDGPIFSVRGKDKYLDKEIYSVNNLLADGTIFQSHWCQNESHFQGMKENTFEEIIYNAPDEKIFNKKGKVEFNPNRKIKIIAASWSDNWNKGFKVYKFLDDHLDFNMYEMTFIGRSPVSFKNINVMSPVTSSELAKIFKLHDIYITASKTEPCSNSLIEALSCGLPAIVFNSGGHPELLHKGGELFEDKNEILEKLRTIVEKYNDYLKNLPEFSISEAAQQYYDFCSGIYKLKIDNRYSPKSISWIKSAKFTSIRLSSLPKKIFKKVCT